MIKEFIEMPRLEKAVGLTFRFLSPNTWTTLSLLLAIFATIVVFSQQRVWGGILFVVASLCDFIDGKVARINHKATHLGAFWDGIVDRFVDALLIFCFFDLTFPTPFPIEKLLFWLLFVTLMPPFIVAYANHRLAIPDPTEKVIWRIAFRIEYFILFILVLLLNDFSPLWSYYALLASFVLMLVTLIQSIILVFIKARNFSQS
jgi:archaetidylinositol phosphate synthase